MVNTRKREYARVNGFDLFAYPLLCTASRAQVHYTALAYACFIFTETYGPYKQTVYYLAHKRTDQLTRKQRGCWEAQ
jgi:hypothetical protein